MRNLHGTLRRRIRSKSSAIAGIEKLPCRLPVVGVDAGIAEERVEALPREARDGHAGAIAQELEEGLFDCRVELGRFVRLHLRFRLREAFVGSVERGGLLRGRRTRQREEPARDQQWNGENGVGPHTQVQWHGIRCRPRCPRLHDAGNVADGKAGAGRAQSNRRRVARDVHRHWVAAEDGVVGGFGVEVREFDVWNDVPAVRAGDQHVRERLRPPNLRATAIEVRLDLRVVDLERPGDVDGGRLQRRDVATSSYPEGEIDRSPHPSSVVRDTDVEVELPHGPMEGRRRALREGLHVQRQRVGGKRDGLVLALDAVAFRGRARPGGIRLRLDLQRIDAERSGARRKHGNPLQNDRAIALAVDLLDTGHRTRRHVELLSPEAIGVPRARESAVPKPDAGTEKQPVRDGRLLILIHRLRTRGHADEQVVGPERLAQAGAVG